jgi:hypothetical protein
VTPPECAKCKAKHGLLLKVVVPQPQLHNASREELWCWACLHKDFRCVDCGEACRRGD